MNFFKVIHWTLNPQKYASISVMRNLLGRIRYQSTEVPPTNDVSTNIKPAQKSNLMEFFDTSDNLAESKIIHGL